MNRQQFEEPEPQAAAVNSTETAPAPSSVPAAAAPEGVGTVMDPSGVVSLPEPVSQQMDTQESEAFLAQLQEQAERQRIYYRLLNGLYTGGALLYILLILVQITRWIPIRADIALYTCLFYIAVLLGTRIAGVRWNKTAGEIAKSGDVRMVGPLVEAYSALSLSQENRPVREALTVLLPRLQASDARVLTEEHRQILNRVLGSGIPSYSREKNRLVLAILKAYEQVGDGSALPFVERLASGRSAGVSREVREAAQACLPFLQERAERERASRELLRAASASDTPSDVLLRPAGGTIEADPQQLLRASASDEA
jgi:hypothetical protein